MPKFLRVALKVLPKLVPPYLSIFIVYHSTTLPWYSFSYLDFISLQSFCECYLISLEYFISPFPLLHHLVNVYSFVSFLTQCFLFLEDFQDPVRLDQIPRIPSLEHHVFHLLNCNYILICLLGTSPPH